LLSVILSLQILVPLCARGHDDPYTLSVNAHKESPLARLYASYCLFLGQPPSRTIWINTANRLDPFMCAVSISFIDTGYL